MRLFVLTLIALGLSVPALAQPTTTNAPTPAQLQAVYDCAAQTDAAARLACYDNAVGALRGAQERGAVAVIDQEGARAVEREAFGFSMPNLARFLPFRGDNRDGGASTPAPALDRQTFAIARVSARAEGRTAFVMENDQVWTTVEAENTRRVRPGAQAMIRRASLGSYFMEIEGTNLGFRVRREQ